MAIKAIEVLETWRQGFLSGNSAPLSEMLHDDFIFTGPSGNRSKQETLDWVSSTPEIRLSDTEILYENDEVFVGFHNVVRSEGRGTGRAMFFARLKDDKVAYWRVHLAPTSD